MNPINQRAAHCDGIVCPGLPMLFTFDIKSLYEKKRKLTSEFFLKCHGAQMDKTAHLLR